MICWKILRRTFAQLLVLSLLVVCVYAQSPTPNYRMPTSVVDMGGTSSHSVNYKLNNSVGQPGVIGRSSSSNFGLYAGFQPTTIEGLKIGGCQGEVGDVNGDGSIDVLDVLGVVNHILSIQILDEYEQCRADCNSDGKINVLDALGIVNVILGIGACVPATSTSRDVTSTVKMWIPDEDVRRVRKGEHTVEKEIRDEEKIELPVYIDSETDIAGVQFIMSYNDAVLTPDEPELTERSAGMMLSFGAQKGELTVVLYSNEGKTIPAGTGPILTVSFRMSDANYQMPDLRMSFEKILIATSCTEVIPVETHPIVVKMVTLPSEFVLEQNYPNPFNPRTDIRYQIAYGKSPTHIAMKIYNILGQEVRTLVDELKEPGSYTVTWDGKDNDGRGAVSGIYLYKLSVASGLWSETKKMLLLK